MPVNRLRRWLPVGNPTLEVGVAAVVGFLAGQSFQGEWPAIAAILALLTGG
ncbi:MAG: hypothetical protein H6R27_1009 [Proteobacteria bacterium]|nr:hypothetical protein [Pseudomonadota bacterium]